MKTAIITGGGSGIGLAVAHALAGEKFRVGLIGRRAEAVQGAAQAVALVLPELKGKFDGCSVRVPTPDVSLIDLTATLGKKTSVEEINGKLKEAANGPLKGVMGYTDEELVSMDFMGTVESSYVDGPSTSVLNGNFIKILAWYDNEWGFTNRAMDIAQMMAKAC